MSEKKCIRFIVTSETVESDELERKIGLKGDRLWKKGSLRPRTIIREPCSGWMIKDEFPPTIELDAAISVFLARLVGVSANLSKLEECIKQLAVSIYSEGLPSLGVSAETLKKLSEFGASLDFDIYILGKPMGELDEVSLKK